MIDGCFNKNAIALKPLYIPSSSNRVRVLHRLRSPHHLLPKAVVSLTSCIR